MHCRSQIYSCNSFGLCYIFIFNNPNKKRTGFASPIWHSLHKNSFWIKSKKTILYIILCIQALLNEKNHTVQSVWTKSKQKFRFSLFFIHVSFWCFCFVFFLFKFSFTACLHFLVKIFEYVNFFVHFRPQAVIRKAQINTSCDVDGDEKKWPSLEPIAFCIDTSLTILKRKSFSVALSRMKLVLHDIYCPFVGWSQAYHLISSDCSFSWLSCSSFNQLY